MDIDPETMLITSGNMSMREPSGSLLRAMRMLSGLSATIRPAALEILELAEQLSQPTKKSYAGM